MKKISILGSGAWATALACVLADNNIETLLYTTNDVKVNDINNNHCNSLIYSDKLSSLIKCTNNLNELINYSTDLLLCVKSDSLIDYLKKINVIINKLKLKVNFINCIKGFIGDNYLTVSDSIKKYILKDNIKGIVSLLGPSFASEVIKKDITLLCAISEDTNLSMYVQNLFSNNYFRVYTSKDMIGCQIASSYKNAIAISSGILKGLNFGDNAKAALITRGLHEITNFGLYFNASKDTFLGLCGIGDLFLTCNSEQSRNFKFGFNITKTKNIQEFIKNNTTTVEGLKTIKVIYEISRQNKLETPIITALYNVIYLGKNLKKEVKNLMLRPLKKE